METELFDSFVEDLLGEKSERPLVIVATSKIDDLLFHILKKYLLPAKNQKEDELLLGDTPLSTLSSRIKICYRLGIIDHSFFLILDKSRRIRNECAHQIAFDIKKSPVREHLSDLRKYVTNRKSFQLTKERYFSNLSSTTITELQCIFVTVCVILEAIYEKVETTKGVTQALNISTK